MPVETPNAVINSSRAVDNVLYDGIASTQTQGGVLAREQSATARQKELIVKLKVGVGVSWLLIVVLIVVMLTKTCDDCLVKSTEESAAASGAVYANITSNSTPEVTYIPQSCHGVYEAVVCGSRVWPSDCNGDGDHGTFAKQHCPQMCGLGCTPASTITETSTSETTTTTTTTSETTATLGKLVAHSSRGCWDYRVL